MHCGFDSQPAHTVQGMQLVSTWTAKLQFSVPDQGVDVDVSFEYSRSHVAARYRLYVIKTDYMSKDVVAGEQGAGICNLEPRVIGRDHV
jgi:hypothetical protein